MATIAKHLEDCCSKNFKSLSLEGIATAVRPRSLGCWWMVSLTIECIGRSEGFCIEKRLTRCVLEFLEGCVAAVVIWAATTNSFFTAPKLQCC